MSKLQITYENLIADAIEPKCRHFRVCGGCQYQHIPYDEQLLQKETFIARAFQKEVEPILPCEPHWRYRNKMEFSFGQDRSGQKFLGLMKRRGRVENLEECFLTHSWFMEVLACVREWWESVPLQAYHPMANRGLLRTLTLREGVRTREKMAILTVSEEPFASDYLAQLIEALPAMNALLLRRQIIQKKVPTRFEETLLSGKDHIHETLYHADGSPSTFRIRSVSFFQPNTLQAETIYQRALEFASLTGNETVLDLYCGTGSLGIFASAQAKKVLGIEIVPEAIEDALVNMKLNGVSNMEVFAGDVGTLLEKMEEIPQVVFVDPPRAGLGQKTIAQLQRLNPETIVYVSCNPVTQAEDCLALGYSIEKLQPIDQFPHTPHVENIALLKRK